MLAESLDRRILNSPTQGYFRALSPVLGKNLVAMKMYCETYVRFVRFAGTAEVEGTPTHVGGADDLSDLLWDAGEHAFLTGILAGTPVELTGHPSASPFAAWAPPAHQLSPSAQGASPPLAGPSAEGDFQAMAALKRAETREGATFWSLLDSPLEMAAPDA